ncbi:cation-translocating P-type ATPase [Salinimicrobium soli]|uniref:cation-translocating P-type ATPase n=1 Tax=Salinimicrobium soli TaxID=1254399 RepID=UPI003AAF1989
MIKDPHHLEKQAVCEQLNVDPEKGLTEDEVNKRLEEYGKNRLQETKPKSIWIIFLEQFLDPVIYILAGATLLAFIFNEVLEGFAVLVVILITAAIGFFMEWQALRSVEALQKLVQTYARVYREGREEQINLSLVVPGDVIILSAGDVVPADARLIQVSSLAIKEAVLTGESNQVEKKLEALPENTTLAERKNMVYKGTIVSRGTGRAVVTSTGDHTVIGEISSLTREATKDRTPLEKKLGKLSRRLIWLTIVLAAIIAVSGYIQGKKIVLMIETGIALAIAAIPEGLPIVATIALAKGMLKLSRRKVVIKKLEAVETLGATGIICTDKTGTLTENSMAVHKIELQDLELGPEEWNAADFKQKAEQLQNFSELLKVGMLCNNSHKKKNVPVGDPVEIGLFSFSEELGYDIEDFRSKYPREQEIPFDAEIKKMATVHLEGENYYVAVKGALESIIGSCDKVLSKEGEEVALKDREGWITRANGLAASGMRILAFACKRVSEIPEENSLFEDLIFLGIVGFLDPPRKDISEAIKTYHNAGIKVVMITGDHPDTARKIGEEIGLVNPNDEVQEVIHGRDVPEPENRTPERERQILAATVFARMAPKQKLDLVDLYQQNNKVVGMLGDGVNDAPALKKADIGIAMGIRGTEAAKEVADVILMDDKFTSTELAIRQGRTIFENIRQFVVYLLSCNLAEIISVAATSVSSLPLPLLPLQILFLNLVTDVFPALALGVGKGDKHVMEQPPRNPKEPILTRKHWITTIVYGLTITLTVTAITAYAWLVREEPREVVNNMAFYTLILAQLLNVFNLPKRHRSFIKNEVTTNPWVWAALVFSMLLVVIMYHFPLMAEVLSLVPLTLEQMGVIAAFGVGGVILTQLVKRLGFTN